jgi:hypothetical protein
MGLWKTGLLFLHRTVRMRVVLMSFPLLFITMLIVAVHDRVWNILVQYSRKN